WTQRPEPWQMLADYDLNWGDMPGVELALKEAIRRGDATELTARRLAAILAREGVWSAAATALSNYKTDPIVQQQQMEVLLSVGKAAEIEKELTAQYKSS